MAESVIGLYKTECVRHDGTFGSVDDLELAALSWVHWFNNDRLHSSLNYTTTIEHETTYYRQINSRQQPLPAQPPSTKPGAVQSPSSASLPAGPDRSPWSNSNGMEDFFTSIAVSPVAARGTTHDLTMNNHDQHLS